jgi:peptidoglycan-associated lipoprotein
MALLTTGCNRRSGGVWDDAKTSSHIKGNGRELWGDDLAQNDGKFFGPNEEDFIPLQEEDLKAQFADGAIPQSKLTPGEFGSGLPGIDQFRIPTAALAAIFRNLYFNTDDHILRGKEYLEAISKVADYLKEHRNTYVFISGHCDERGPEAYNLSLGARRANYVRSLLIQKGVDLNQIHTISYGKEKPAEFGHNSQAWAKNRRAEYKIYQK